MPRRGRREFPQVPLDLGMLVGALGDAGVFGDTATTTQNKQDLELERKQQLELAAKRDEALKNYGRDLKLRGYDGTTFGLPFAEVDDYELGRQATIAENIGKTLESTLGVNVTSELLKNPEAIQKLAQSRVGQELVKGVVPLSQFGSYNAGTEEFYNPARPGEQTIVDGKPTYIPPTMPSVTPRAPIMRGREDYVREFGSSGSSGSVPSFLSTDSAPATKKGSGFLEGFTGEISPLIPEVPKDLKFAADYLKGKAGELKESVTAPFKDPAELGKLAARFGLGAFGIHPPAAVPVAPSVIPTAATPTPAYYGPATPPALPVGFPAAAVNPYATSTNLPPTGLTPAQIQKAVELLRRRY